VRKKEEPARGTHSSLRHGRNKKGKNIEEGKRREEKEKGKSYLFFSAGGNIKKERGKKTAHLTTLAPSRPAEKRQREKGKRGKEKRKKKGGKKREDVLSRFSFTPFFPFPLRPGGE